MEHLRFPIGKFDKTYNHSVEEASAALRYFGEFPSILREKVKDLSSNDLNNVYREGGWNIRQVVHHLADSHTNMYIRIKMALTEDNPSVSGYEEALWAELPDNELDIELPLKMIEAVHAKVVALLINASEADWERTFFHLGYQMTYVLKNVIPLYQWHSKHHLEHIKIALTRIMR